MTLLIVLGNFSATPIIAGGSQMLHHLGSQAHKHNEIFNEAVIILDAMKSSPSCNRVAATRLVESCQSVGGKHTDDAQADEHEALDRIRSMYAARLAICELDGAGASVPAPCLPVTVSPPATPKFRFSFVKKSQVLDSGSDLLPKEVIGNCLKALESRPQWWTSYSNNRQNAMVICQATRLEMEREELLDLHRAIVETSSKLHQGLQEALYNSALETSQHHTFLEEVRQLQMRLVEEIEGSASVTQSALHKLLRQVHAGLDRISTSVTSVMDQLHREAGTLEKVEFLISSSEFRWNTSLQFTGNQTHCGVCPFHTRNTTGNAGRSNFTKPGVSSLT